ncbi:MAG: hypothetical protein HONBIEJF_01085 [Fimbriimonadaceae bacterium]|nr:hypothetical protein [Fimbriimonadaceae bacterium]
MKLYVGNLTYSVTEAELHDLFSPFGQVDSVVIVNDKFTGQSRGFAFVEMPNAAECEAAINGLNGKEYQRRALTVNEARPREERSDRGGYGGGGGGGGRDRDRGGRSGGGRR